MMTTTEKTMMTRPSSTAISVAPQPEEIRPPSDTHRTLWATSPYVTVGTSPIPSMPRCMRPWTMRTRASASCRARGAGITWRRRRWSRKRRYRCVRRWAAVPASEQQEQPRRRSRWQGSSLPPTELDRHLCREDGNPNRLRSSSRIRRHGNVPPKANRGRSATPSPSPDLLSFMAPGPSPTSTSWPAATSRRPAECGASIRMAMGPRWHRSAMLY
mmetsp:Transcript_1944/g.5646  ORF Transcript_1944/g.5646 Transcript_1944/m.5646 type:complete len:215 (+) Transcript_1944:232-876(+)